MAGTTTTARCTRLQGGHGARWFGSRQSWRKRSGCWTIDAARRGKGRHSQMKLTTEGPPDAESKPAEIPDSADLCSRHYHRRQLDEIKYRTFGGGTASPPWRVRVKPCHQLCRRRSICRPSDRPGRRWLPFDVPHQLSRDRSAIREIRHRIISCISRRIIPPRSA